MFLVAGANVVSPILFVEGSARRKRAVTLSCSQETVLLRTRSSIFLQESPRLLPASYNFVSDRTVCWESYFEPWAFYG